MIIFKKNQGLGRFDHIMRGGNNSRNKKRSDHEITKPRQRRQKRVDTTKNSTALNFIIFYFPIPRTKRTSTFGKGDGLQVGKASIQPKHSETP